LTLKVIQFSTGNVGRKALEMIIGRPDLELVGVHAASPDKVGRDAAELCGLTTPTGVLATDDLDALVALGADCVVYTNQAETRPDAVVHDILTLAPALAAELEAGRLPLDHLRGRTALEPEQQAAEILVRRELGLTRLDDLRLVEGTTFELANRRRATAALQAHELEPQRVACRDDKVEAATRWELEELVLA
jgi:hypothetical protein